MAEGRYWVFQNGGGRLCLCLLYTSETNKSLSIQEATDQVGISRSSFYKYKDDIVPFYDNTRGRTITFVTQMDDRPGLLSEILHIVSDLSLIHI